MMGFVNKNFEDVLTCTRASTATYVDPTGIIRTAGVDVPRFTFENGEGKGLLVEEQRTNLFTYSEDFSNAAWSKLRSLVSSNVITAPDGTLTADKLVETTSDDSHYMVQSTSFVSGEAYTVSFYAKAAERNILTVNFRNNVFPITSVAEFDLINGTASILSGTGIDSVSIEPSSNGFYRCSVTGTADKTVTESAIWFRLSNLKGTVFPSYQGDGTSGIYIWGSQLERG